MLARNTLRHEKTWRTLELCFQEQNAIVQSDRARIAFPFVSLASPLVGYLKRAARKAKGRTVSASNIHACGASKHGRTVTRRGDAVEKRGRGRFAPHRG